MARRVPLLAFAAPAAAAALAAALLDGRARGAASQAAAPFVLVAGLLLLGLVADGDGVFRWASDRLLAITTCPLPLLSLALVLVAVVTAVLNLDTAVVFLTPILIATARGAGADEEAFLYGSVLMANASSLLLPGANLTNLLVLAHEPIAGAIFVRRVLPTALATALVTAAGLVALAAWRARRRAGDTVAGSAAIGAPAMPRPAVRVRPLGAVACAVAAVLVIVLAHPALPVLAVGVVAALARVRDRTLTLARAVEAVGPGALLALFSLSVLLGFLARSWSGPADLLASASSWATCGIGALAAAGVNNLPAAVLLSAAPPPRARALLLGLDVGPNLAVTGSLSAYLWLRSARAAGAEPSVRRFSALGVPLGLAAMLAGLLVG